MRKQLLVLSLFATLLFPVFAFAQAPAAEAIQINPDDTVHLCIKGEADAVVMNCPTPDQNHPRGPDCPYINLDDVGSDLFKDGQIYDIKNSGRSNKISIIDKGSYLLFTNATLQYIRSNNSTGAEDTLVTIFDRNVGFDPYIDVTGPNDTPCTRAHSDSEVFTIQSAAFNLHITAIPTVEEAPPPADVQPSPAPATPDGVSGGGSFGDNSGPTDAPGGCNMSMALGGFNFALSTFFALILGAHAVLRFRKK